jgi:hypothetical protein
MFDGEILASLRAEFRKGRKRAALDAALYCRSRGSLVPAWAFDTVTEELFLRYWREDHPKKKRGRKRDEGRHQYCYDAVKLLRSRLKQDGRHEFTWEKCYEITGELFKMDPDRVKNGYIQANKREKARTKWVLLSPTEMAIIYPSRS